MTFYLGTHQPEWLAHSTVPLFVSARRLRVRRPKGAAACRWALDSGGFTELNLYGEWKTSPVQYVEEVRRWRDAFGNLDWAAPQDWMCEPVVRGKTGKTTREHQTLTVANLLELRRLAPDLPWVPVLQGWHPDEYLAHVAMYAAAGVDVTKEATVGVGTVCRRQATAEGVEIFRRLHAIGVRCHGFGVKTEGLKKAHQYLTSADSLAWSFHARKQRRPMLSECKHAACNNCYRYAVHWREKVTKDLC